MNCKFCNSTTERIFENGVQCKICYTVQVIDMPSDQVINNYYLEFNEKYHGGGPANNQIKYAFQYLKLVKKYVKKFNSILDVGCSNSPFPNLVYREGFNVSVLDVVKPLNLNDKIVFYEGLLDNGFDFPKSIKFDVVTAWAVIEHVKDVDISLENISNVLEDGGYLFLTTPEIGTSLSKWNIGKTPWFFPPEHLHILSPLCLKKIGEKYNLDLLTNGHFEITSFRYFVRYFLVGWGESLLGTLFFIISKNFYFNLKKNRVSSYKGIQYLVFKKREL